MRWRKLGRVILPCELGQGLRSHAAVPIAESTREDRHRVYFSSRDSFQRSHTVWVELNLAHPEPTVSPSCTQCLPPGGYGDFDEDGAMATWLVELAGIKYLYYIGWNAGSGVPFRNALGLAISEDGGLSYRKISHGPILDRSIYDPGFVASACVLVESGVWRMWYLSCIRWDNSRGIIRHFYHIKYAESRDGISWKRSGRVCIDFQDNDEYAISRPCVVKDGDLYRMWYSHRGESYRIGYAESKDGLEWIRKDDMVGIDVSPSGWDSEMIEYPFVFDHGGNRYMLYNGNGYGKTGIGLAVLDKA